MTEVWIHTINKHISRRAHMHTHTPTHTHAHAYISAHACTQAHRHTHTHTHIHTHTRTHTHTHTHAPMGFDGAEVTICIGLNTSVHERCIILYKFQSELDNLCFTTLVPRPLIKIEGLCTRLVLHLTILLKEGVIPQHYMFTL